MSVQIDIFLRTKNYTHKTQESYPEFIWNGRQIDLKILLSLLFASKQLEIKGQKNSKNAKIRLIMGLFNCNFSGVSNLKSDINKYEKHKTCRICAVFSKTYEQIFFRDTENKILSK